MESYKSSMPSAKCVPTSKGLENNTWFVLIAYMFAFLPHFTRNSFNSSPARSRVTTMTNVQGWIYFLVSLCSAAYLSFYANIQMSADRPKDMAAALTAIMVNCMYLIKSDWMVRHAVATYKLAVRAVDYIKRKTAAMRSR